jgi:hypothetical protein
MERADPHCCIAGYKRLHPPPHLFRRPIGKRDGKESVGNYAGGDAISEAPRNYPRFPGTRTGKYEQRPADMLDRCSLFVVQVIE